MFERDYQEEEVIDNAESRLRKARVRSGNYDAYGNRTSMADVVDSYERPYKERVGEVERDENFFTAFGKATKRTVKQIGIGYAKTFGFDGAARRGEAERSVDRSLDPIKFSDDFVAAVGDSLASGLTDSALIFAPSAIATVAGTPALGAALGTALTYSRMYGENREMVENLSTSDMTHGEKVLTSVVLTGVHTAIEKGLGIESGFGKAIGHSVKRKLVSEAAEKVLRGEVGDSVQKKLINEFIKPTKFVVGALKGGFGEVGEESLQETATIATEQLVSDGAAPVGDLVERLIIQPLRALPAGMLMGGVSAKAAAYADAAKKSVPDVKEGDIREIHSVVDEETGEKVLNSESIIQEQKQFAAMTEMISKVKNISSDEAIAISDLMRRYAHLLAKTERQNGDVGAMPVRFISDLSTVALQSNLSSANVKTLLSILESGEESSSQDFLDYLNNALGESDALSKFQSSLRDVSEARELRGYTEMVYGLTDRDMASFENLSDADTAYKNSVSAAIKAAILGAPESGKKGTTQVIDLARVADGLSPKQMNRLYFYGTTIKVGKQKYFAQADENGVTITPVSDETAKRNTFIERFVEQDTDSGRDVAKERARYSMVANRYIKFDSFKAVLRGEKAASEQLSTSDYDLFGSEGKGFITGLEIRETVLDYGDDIDGLYGYLSEYGEEAVSAAESIIAERDAAYELNEKAKADQEAADAAEAERSAALITARAEQEKSQSIKSLIDKLNERKKQIKEDRRKEGKAWVEAEKEKSARSRNVEKELTQKSKLATEEVEVERRSAAIEQTKGKVSVLTSRIKQALPVKNMLSEDGLSLLERLNERIDNILAGEVSIGELESEFGIIKTMAEELSEDAYEKASESNTGMDRWNKQRESIESLNVEAEELSMEAEANLFISNYTKASEQIASDRLHRKAEAESKAAYLKTLAERKKELQEEIKALNKRPESARSELPRKQRLLDGIETFERALSDEQPLAQAADENIRGVYLRSNKTAIFFANADAGTVIHELTHHMFNVLPASAMTKLQSDFAHLPGVAADIEASDIHGVATQEAVANSLLSYLIDGKLPDSVTDIDSFNLLTGTLLSTYKSYFGEGGYTLSDNTRAMLDQMVEDFDDTDLHSYYATAVADDIVSEPPTAEMADEYTNPPSDVPLLQSDGAFNNRNTLSSKLHGIISHKMAGDTHQNLISVLRDMFPEKGDAASLNDFSYSNLYDAYNSLKSMAKKTDSASAYATADKMIAARPDVKRAVDPRDVRDPAAKRFARRMLAKIESAIINNNAIFGRIDDTLRFLDGLAPDGEFHKNIGQPLHDARTRFGAIIIDAQTRIGEMRKGHKFNEKSISSTKPIIIDGRAFMKKEAAILSIVNRKVNGEYTNARQAVIDSNKISAEEIDALSSAVANDSDLASYADYLVKAYEILYDMVAPIYEIITGKKMPRIANYIPVQRENGLWIDDSGVMGTIDSIVPTGRMAKKKNMNMFKERGKIKGDTIALSDPDFALDMYARSIANYMAKAETVRELMKVITSPQMKSHIESIYGQQKASRLVNHLKDSLASEMYATGRITALSDAEIFVREQHERFTVLTLAGRIMTVFKQPVSFLNFMAHMEPSMRSAMTAPVNLARANAVVASNIAKNVGRAMSGEYKNSGFVHLLSGTDMYDLMMRYAPHLIQRHGNPVSGIIDSSKNKMLFGMKIAGVPVIDLLMGGIQSADAATIGAAWKTGFDNFVVKYSKTMDAETAKLEAARKVNYIISQTQPPTFAHERGLALRNNEYLKGFVPFSGQTMQIWNNWLNQVIAPTFKMIATKDLSGLVKGQAGESSIIQKYAIGVVAPAIALGVLNRKRPQDDDKELIEDILLYPLSSFPVLGGAFNYSMQSGRFDGITPSYAEGASLILSAVADYVQYKKGEKKYNEYNIRTLENAVSYMAGSPTELSRMFRHAYQKFEQNGWSDLTREEIFEVLVGKPKD